MLNSVTVGFGPPPPAAAAAAAAAQGAAGDQIPSLQAPGSMLKMLAQLQQLQHLELVGLSNPRRMGGQDPPEPYILWPAASSAYTAILASPHLRRLDVGRAGIPKDAWQHILTVPHQLQQLARFQTAASDRLLSYAVIILSYAEVVWDSAGVAAVVHKMPSLCSCHIAVQPEADLAPLAQLSSLTYLTAHVQDSRTIRTFTAFTKLQQLRLECAKPVVAADLVALSTLKQLCRFTCKTTVGCYCTGGATFWFAPPPAVPIPAIDLQGPVST